MFLNALLLNQFKCLGQDFAVIKNNLNECVECCVFHIGRVLDLIQGWENCWGSSGVLQNLILSVTFFYQSKMPPKNCLFVSYFNNESESHHRYSCVVSYCRAPDEQTLPLRSPASSLLNWTWRFFRTKVIHIVSQEVEKQNIRLEPANQWDALSFEGWAGLMVN